jgi:hypothetical protein
MKQRIHSVRKIADTFVPLPSLIIPWVQQK